MHGRARPLAARVAAALHATGSDLLYADLYRFVERTPLGQETPEARTVGQTLDEVISILAQSLRH